MLQLNKHYLMKRGTERNAILRDDRKVVSPVDSFVFTGFAVFTASVFEAVFLCPIGIAQTSASTRLFNFLPLHTGNHHMNDSASLDQQMVVTTPTATRSVKLHSGASVGMAGVAQFILGQKDIRDCVPFLSNRKNVI